MITKPKGYDDVKPYEETEKLPIGAYVLKILEVEKGDNYLELQFDIAEGEFKDFYKRQYENSTLDDKKWKGKTRVWLPKNDGSDQDNWTMRKLKTIMNAFEDSNKNFRWEWDETAINGLVIGGLFNSKEYDFNGLHGFYTNCKKLIAADKVREGKYTLPTTDYLNGTPSELPEGFERLQDNDIPF